MTLFLLLLAVAIIGVVAAVAAGRVRGGLDEPTTSLPYRPLPDGDLEPSDVDDVRFNLGLRGYRMDEVDTVLRRLATALAERDEQIAALRRAQQQPAPEPAADDEPGPHRPDGTEPTADESHHRPGTRST